MKAVLFSRWPLALAVLLTAGLLGCGGGDELRTFDEQADSAIEDDHHHHDHAHGPHDGHIIELGGDDYHAELVFDAATRTLEVYLLASDVKTPLTTTEESISVRLKTGDEENEFRLLADPLEGETDGSSHFKLEDAQLPDAIKDAEDLEGTVVVTIDGTQYRGPITHDHGHDHGHAH